MQMPNSARQVTANTGGQSRVSVDCLVPRREPCAPPRDQAAEADLGRKARRQGVLLMGASGLFALALAAGVWWLVRQLL
jgi:hypothetical protein